MTKSRLVGYVRKATGGRTIKITVDKKTFNKCETYKTADGEHEMVGLDVSLDKMQELINGEREVTSVIQIDGGEWVSRGNPNQAKLVKEIRDMGFKVKVKHNQIHVEGIRFSPYHDGVPGWSVPEGETYGMTMTEAQLFIVNHRGD